MTKKVSSLPKLDLAKLHRTDYVAPRRPAFVEIKPATYLAISGQGAPGGPAFSESIGALYGMAFTVKMTRKFAGLQDYAISKLECTYGTEADVDLSTLPRDDWPWTLMIRTPEFVTPADLAQAVVRLTEKGKGQGTDRVLLKTLHEGSCVQMLHVGPYERIGETIQAMEEHAIAHGRAFHGSCHEIYVSDPRRVEPAKLKTILRHPVR